MAQIKKMRVLIDAAMAENSSQLEKFEKERLEALVQIGNILHPSVPISDDEVSLQPIYSFFGLPTLFSFYLFTS